MPNSSETELRLKPIEVSNIAELISLGEELNLSPWTAQNYIDELKNCNAIMLRLVSAENQTVGFVVGRRVAGLIDAGFDAEIYNIAVRPSDQGNGSAQMLLDAFVDQCRSADVLRVWLEVRQSNLRAIRFYEKNGFEKIQTRNHFYDNPREHAILMCLDLKVRGS